MQSDTAKAWLEYGRSYARYPSLWDGSLQIAVIGPQGPHPEKVFDYSGRANHGATEYSPTWKNAWLRSAAFQSLNLNGVDQIVAFGTSPALGFTTDSQFSITAWVNQSAKGSDASGGTICGRYAGSAGYLLYVYSTDGISPTKGVYFQDNGTGFTSNATISLGTWTHVAYTRNATSEQIWINGRSVASKGKATLTAAAGGFCVGTYTSPTTQVWNGSIADVRVYSRVMTQSEIATLAQHPLAAYETVRPRYWMFGATTHLWPWQIRRSRRMRGKR